MFLLTALVSKEVWLPFVRWVAQDVGPCVWEVAFVGDLGGDFEEVFSVEEIPDLCFQPNHSGHGGWMEDLHL